MKIEKSLQKRLMAWKDMPKRKPLVLEGARQVGKTWLLKNLGKTAFQDFAYFNFDEEPSLKQFFENTKDVTQILKNLSLVHGKAILPQKTLIIFDEIQECNEALNALKYFYENAPEYAVASAGSLLGVALSRGQSFPVGKVTFMQVHPVTFAEFLSADDLELAEYLESFDRIEAIPDIFFHRLVNKLKTYLITGGMPEAISTLLETGDIASTQQVLQDILNAYSLDFSKYVENKDMAKIHYIWSSLPSQLARDNKKFIYQTVREGARARDYEDALLWLSNAGLLHRVYRNNKPALPLAAYDDLSAFKAYMLDTGLLRRHAKLDPIAIRDGNRLFTEFKGALTENFVLQHLIALFEGSPRYWTSGNQAEVDFLIQMENEIIPIEVKSEENVKSRSLAIYQERFAPSIRIRYSLRNLEFNNGLLNIPLFLIDQTEKLINLAKRMQNT